MKLYTTAEHKKKKTIIMIDHFYERTQAYYIDDFLITFRI